MREFDREPSPAAARLLMVGQLSPATLLLFGLGFASLAVALTIGLKGGDVGYELLQRHHVDLLGFTYARPLLAMLLFMFVCALSVVMSVPGASALTVLGGLLFGWFEAAIYVQLASVAGAACVFLLARTVLANAIRDRAGPRLGRFADGFNRNAFRYVFLIHLFPLLPFGMIIALPAACGIRLRTYLGAAFLGLLPSTLLLANLGDGLGFALFREGGVSLANLLSPQILLAAGGLAGLALVPVVYQRLTRRELT